MTAAAGLEKRRAEGKPIHPESLTCFRSRNHTMVDNIALSPAGTEKKATPANTGFISVDGGDGKRVLLAPMGESGAVFMPSHVKRPSCSEKPKIKHNKNSEKFTHRLPRYVAFYDAHGVEPKKCGIAEVDELAAFGAAIRSKARHKKLSYSEMKQLREAGYPMETLHKAPVPAAGPAYNPMKKERVAPPPGKRLENYKAMLKEYIDFTEEHNVPVLQKGKLLTHHQQYENILYGWAHRLLDKYYSGLQNAQAKQLPPGILQIAAELVRFLSSHEGGAPSPMDNSAHSPKPI